MWVPRPHLAWLVLLASFAIAPQAGAQSCPSFPPPGRAQMELQLTPVTLQVLQPSLIPVPGTDGFIHLAFAAQVTNLDRGTAIFTQIRPVDPLHGFAFAGESGVVDMDGNDITNKLLSFAAPQSGGTDPVRSPDTTELAGGAAGIAFFDVRFTTAHEVPAFLSTQLVVHLPGKPLLEERMDPVPVGCLSPVVISPPLAGPRWWDGNGCCRVISPHRGATLPVNGRIRPPEQFAIDFVQLTAAGGCCTGPVKDLRSWPFFGAPVLAVADGVVVERVDGMKEQIPGEVKGITAQNAAGNHIIEEIGQDRYVLYAHLATDSIPRDITVGAALKRGVRIGSVGNTGSSTAPHLHFQVMDRPSVLDAIGLPFVFDRQILEGSVSGTANQANNAYESGARVTLVPAAPSDMQADRMPIEGQVFDYGGP
jgi:Peptidase family M23